MDLNIGLIIIGLLLAALAALYARRQARSSERSLRIQESQFTADIGHGLIQTDADHLPESIPNYFRVDIPYINRGSTDIQMELSQLVNNKRLVIASRTGLGKTREAIELVRLLESNFGEKLTVLLIKRFPVNLEKYLTAAEPSRCVVVLFDDLHLLARRFAYLKPHADSQAHFQLLANDMLRKLEAVSSGRLWVIATLRTEPGVVETIDFAETPWNTFSVCQLKPLSKASIAAAISAIAQDLKIEVSPEASAVLVNNSDGTFMGIIAYFRKKASENIRVLHSSNIEDFTGTYPLIWQTEYRNFISPNVIYRSLFLSLSIFRQLGLTPWKTLVLNLASKLVENPFVSRQAFERALELLRAWIDVKSIADDSLEGRNGSGLGEFLVCADGYLQDLIDVNKDATIRKEVAKFLVGYQIKLYKAEREISNRYDDELSNAIYLLNLETAPLLLRAFKLASHSFKFDIAFTLALMRYKEAFLYLVSYAIYLRFNAKYLKFVNILSRNKMMDSMDSCERQQLAICLAWFRDTAALPEIMTTIDDTPPGKIRNDIILELPAFQEKEALQLILSFIRSWEDYDLQNLAQFALCPVYLFDKKFITYEEATEQEEMHSWMNPYDKSNHVDIIRRAISCANERVRFRGHFAAAILFPERIGHFIRGLKDPSPKIRGATLMLLSAFGRSKVKSNVHLRAQLDAMLLAKDDLYGDEKISDIAGRVKIPLLHESDDYSEMPHAHSN